MKKNYFNCQRHNYRYIWFVIIGLILGSFFGALRVNAISIKHDYYDMGNDSSFVFPSAIYSSYAQNFTIGKSLDFNDGIISIGCSLLLYRANNPGIATVYLYEFASEPEESGSIESSSVNLNGIATGSPYTWVYFNWTNPINLTVNTKYCIEFECFCSGINKVYWLIDSTSPIYNYGLAWRYHNILGWQTTTYDTMFRIYGYNKTLPVKDIGVNTLSQNQIFLNWTENIDTDYIRLGIRQNANPPSPLGDINYTGNNYTWQGGGCSEKWHFGFWAYNKTYEIISEVALFEHERLKGYCYSDINLYENIINATGTLELQYGSSNLDIYANYTGNYTGCYGCSSTNLTIYKNIINVTGSTNSIYSNLTGWKVWVNYTGNFSGCSGIIWVNYSDNNITYNISFNKENDTNISDYKINENNWLYLGASLLLDNTQLFLMIILSIWLFAIAKYLDTKDMTLAYMQFGVSLPLTLLMLPLCLLYSLGYVVIIVIIGCSLAILGTGYFSEEEVVKRKVKKHKKR